MFKKYSIAVVIVIAFLISVGYIGGKAMLTLTGASDTYLPNKIIIPKYSWQRDHCKSCNYLASKIEYWMRDIQINYTVYNRSAQQSTRAITASSMAANYLKLYELNECHKYYRNTAIGPFHIALELKALEEERLE